jgi:enoyl-CoA hydratase
MTRIHAERRENVAVLRMDDGKVNAIQGAFIDELGEALDRASEDRAVGAVLVVGRDGVFSGGLDLKTLPGLPRAELIDTIGRYSRLMLRLFGFAKPAVAAVSGHALAGGCVLALACDVRIGAKGAFRIGLNEVAIGLPLPTFVVELARASVAPAHHADALLGGRIYDPEGARDVGYLQELEEPAALFERALARAEALARLPAAAYRETKQRLRGPALERGERALADDLSAFLERGPFV